MAWFVNDHQTKEERRKKYKMSRLAGYPPEEAQRHRDWRINVLTTYLKEMKLCPQKN